MCCLKIKKRNHPTVRKRDCLDVGGDISAYLLRCHMLCRDSETEKIILSCLPKIRMSEGPGEETELIIDSLGEKE